MKIEQGRVVAFHYQSLDEQGSEIESSRNGEPMISMIGSKSIMPALEEALLGRKEGEQFEVQVPPHKAYGNPLEDAVRRVPIKHLIDPPRKLKTGQVVRMNTERGPREVTILKIGRFNVDVNLNHPLAGQTIVFKLEIIAVRNATGAELAHGHAHGADGHAHH